MHKRRFDQLRRISLLALLIGLAGCTIHPPGEREEREAALRAGKPFEKQFDARQIAPLPANPTPDDLVNYALLNNASLERRYWEWRSAIEQIPQDGTQTATLNLSAGTMITRGRTSWGSSTAGLSNDPMTDIKLPGKLDAAARQSLENARAAGVRFTKAKYELRSQVLGTYYDYALTAELIRLSQNEQQLLRTMAEVTETRNRTGGAGQQDVLKARNEVEMLGNDIANMESQLPAQRAAINALLSRPVDAPLPTPTELPASHFLHDSDQMLVELAAKRNPELRALAHEIHGRADGIELAKLQYLPDFNLSASTDLLGITQSVLGQATIPFFRYEALNAGIAQAQANLRTSAAMRRQAGNDLAAQVIADIAIIRDADRQLDFFKHAILPRAREAATLGRSAYQTGRASLLDWLDSQRSLIAIERLIANLTVAREKRAAELETITALDLSH